MAIKRGKRRRRSGGGNIWTFLLLIIPAALVVMSTTILFMIGMIPTVVAYVIDRDPEKPAPITVGALNFCGCLPFAINLWLQGNTLAKLGTMLVNPMIWLVMYGAAAAGWAFYFGIPPMVASAEVMRAEKRIAELRQRKAELVGAWGPDVAGDIFEQGASPREDSSKADAETEE